MHLKPGEPKPLLRQRPEWQDLSPLFPDERDCLLSFLVLEAAEVLEGAKPANLVNVVNRRRPCGRNLYLLWERHGSNILQQSGLEVRELVDHGNSVLLFLYRSDTLKSLLALKSVGTILLKAGYADPSDLENTLSDLQSRVTGKSFPHEIGVFLGYPLKDVVGFMGWAPLPFTYQGPWKIFGDPHQSLRLAEIHRLCRCRVSLQLASADNPRECLQGKFARKCTGNIAAPFSHLNENEYHYPSVGDVCLKQFD